MQVRLPPFLLRRSAVLAGLFVASLVHAQGASADRTLKEVEVSAEAAPETATGPVTGYRARRAVSASKTDTPLAETPQAVTVVTRDQMMDQGAGNLQDALNYAAGVRGNAYGLDSRTDSVLIRGSDATIYIDGLRQNYDYYTSASRPDPYTLERLEVLRGPSAVLYGQGSTGGLVNIVTKRPQAEFQGEVGVQVGNHHHKQVQADITGPLTADGQWLYRLVAVGRDADTQVDSVRDDRVLLMPTLTWRPSGVTSLTLQGLYQNDKTGSTSQFLPWSGMLTANPNGKIPTSRFIGEPGDRYDTQRRTLGWQFEHQFNDQWTLRQNFRYAANRNSYYSYYANGWSGVGFLDAAQRVVGRSGFGSESRTRTATVDQHLQGTLQTGTARHTLLAGLDYTRYRNASAYGAGDTDTVDVYAPVLGLAGPIVMGDATVSHQRQAGLYLQDQIKIGQQWTVVAGLRHDRVTNTVAGEDDQKSQATTKRLGVMYHLANGVTPYASYSESFTPVAGVNVHGARFKPLEGQQVEAGVKYLPADGRQQITAAVYSLKEKNQSTNDPNDAQNTIQVGQTKNRGVELEWKGAITPAFEAIASYNYTDLDRQLTQVPRNQVTAWGKWRFSVGEVRGLSAGAGLRYFGSFRDGVAPTTPTVTLIDAMLAWDTPQWRYALNVNNLSDKRYNAVCLARGDCWFGARRSVVASAAYRF